MAKADSTLRGCILNHSLSHEGADPLIHAEIELCAGNVVDGGGVFFFFCLCVLLPLRSCPPVAFVVALSVCRVYLRLEGERRWQDTCVLLRLETQRSNQG